ESASYGGVVVAIDTRAEVAANRVYHYHLHIPCRAYFLFQQIEVCGEVKGTPTSILDCAHDRHALQIGVGGFQARHAPIGRPSPGRQDDAVALRSPGFGAWPWAAGRHGGRHRERHLRLAETGFAGDERELAEGDAARPQPGHRHNLDVAGAASDENGIASA